MLPTRRAQVLKFRTRNGKRQIQVTYLGSGAYEVTAFEVVLHYGERVASPNFGFRARPHRTKHGVYLSADHTHNLFLPHDTTQQAATLDDYDLVRPQGRSDWVKTRSN